MTNDTINDGTADEELFAYGGFHVRGAQCPMNVANGIDRRTESDPGGILVFKAYDRAVGELIDGPSHRGCVPESVARKAWLDGIELLRTLRPTAEGHASRRYDDAIEVATDVAADLGWIEQADLDDGDTVHPTIADRTEDWPMRDNMTTDDELTQIKNALRDLVAIERDRQCGYAPDQLHRDPTQALLDGVEALALLGDDPEELIMDVDQEILGIDDRLPDESDSCADLGTRRHAEVLFGSDGVGVSLYSGQRVVDEIGWTWGELDAGLWGDDRVILDSSTGNES